MLIHYKKKEPKTTKLEHLKNLDVFECSEGLFLVVAGGLVDLRSGIFFMASNSLYMRVRNLPAIPAVFDVDLTLTKRD